MNRIRAYMGRCRTRKDTIAKLLLIVLFLSLAVPSALTGNLKDGPQLDKLPAVTDIATTDYDGRYDAMIRELSFGADETATGADIQRAETLLYIAPTPAPKPTASPETSHSPVAQIYEIPLSVDLQQYTYDLCTELGVDYETVLAIMYIESRYQPDVISKTHDYGLMQINKWNHKWLSEALGYTYATSEEMKQNFLDPYKNILAGVYMLSESAEKYSEPHRILMVYNLGPSGARNLWDKGIYSTKYSRAVVAKADEIRGS